MTNLTPKEECWLIKRMANRTQDSWNDHATWTLSVFGKIITVDECMDLHQKSMNMLTSFQLDCLTKHMEKYEDESMVAHCIWVKQMFNKMITPDECADLYLKEFCGIGEEQTTSVFNS